MKDGIIWFGVVMIGAVMVLLVQTGGINQGGFEPTPTRTEWIVPVVEQMKSPTTTPTGGWFETPLPTSAWATATPTRTPRGWKSPTPTATTTIAVTQEVKP